MEYGLVETARWLRAGPLGEEVMSLAQVGLDEKPDTPILALASEITTHRSGLQRH